MIARLDMAKAVVKHGMAIEPEVMIWCSCLAKKFLSPLAPCAMTSDLHTTTTRAGAGADGRTTQTLVTLNRHSDRADAVPLLNIDVPVACYIC
jgi:hypothetical protein